MIEPASIYSDGGVIGRNPSPRGGTWAYCLVDARNRRCGHDNGVVTPDEVGLPAISNNLTEFLAALRGLEAVPDGWSGTLWTDSEVTCSRLVGGRCSPSLPDEFWERARAAFRRLGPVVVNLVGGHPKPHELARGYRTVPTIGGRRRLPVSHHNVFCDRLCGEAGRPPFTWRATAS